MDDHKKRVKELLDRLYEEWFPTQADREAPVEDMFAPKPSEHSLAAETILASSEVMAALARNGVRPADIRDKVFEVLIEMAKPFPGLHGLVSDWLKDGMENSHRLEELHDYNTLISGGANGAWR